VVRRKIPSPYGDWNPHGYKPSVVKLDRGREYISLHLVKYSPSRKVLEIKVVDMSKIYVYDSFCTMSCCWEI
jgi:hypothetical protein